MADVLASDCTDDEAVSFAIEHYFLPEELAEAQAMLERGCSYEEALAYLVKRGMDTLRNSSDGNPNRPRHLFLTIPGGTVFIRHPTRPFPERPVLTTSVAQLASLAFPAPSHAASPARQDAVGLTTGRQIPLFDDGSLAPSSGPPRVGKASTRTRPKKISFVEGRIRVGTKKLWWEYPGWIVKQGGLGYAVQEMRNGGHCVHLVHLNSNREMATVYLSLLDEDAHARLRAWVAEALQLTDWQAGITRIIKEKQGEQKQRAWERQLEELWRKHQQRLRQRPLFDFGEREEHDQ